jgi:hypothetical protein
MRMIFGAIGGMKFGRGNQSTRRKPTPAPLCPPQNPAWQTRSRTPDCSGGKPATKRLSYGAAFFSPILSPLTTRRFTVEVFDPASTRVMIINNYAYNHLLISLPWLVGTIGIDKVKKICSLITNCIFWQGQKLDFGVKKGAEKWV